MRYVALLRGINVGGKNKVDMKQLKGVFEDAGISDVRTYKRMTIRNVNTARKLLELMEK